MGVFDVAGNNCFERLEFDVKVGGWDGKEAAYLTDDKTEGDWFFFFMNFWHTVDLWHAMLVGIFQLVK